MKRDGTHPETGYIRYIFERGDVREGDTITIKGDPQRRTVERVGILHVLCPSWPQDIIINYADITSVEPSSHARTQAARNLNALTQKG